ncbi:MAG: bifunctional 4-hydroxy-2-oxoglutarate aldolase/2-dehydro-3-deoxy-phosphogluconate aldolase [Clostridia bacterium]
MDMFDKLSLAGLVPVIKVEDAQDAVPLCRALLEGGLPVAEITFRTAAAEQAIKNVHEALPEVMLGAGTVLSVEQVKKAVQAGASYIVSPGFNPEVVRYCVDAGIAILPGCANPTDIECALSMGLNTVKFFPAEALGGVKLIKAMSAPYGQIYFVPTGGVNEKNVLDYLAFDKVKAVGGSWMVPGDAIKQKDWATITELTKRAVQLILGLEIAHVGVNCEDAEQAARETKKLQALLGWPVVSVEKSNMLGGMIELMKGNGRGAHGHIAIACNSLARAQWHLARKGFAFEEAPLSVNNGKTMAIYLKDDIAGFGVHLLQK